MTVVETLPVYAFDHPHERPPRELVDLLGGKGAGLAEMTTVLGLPVPPGFTLALPLCAAYRAGGWPDGLDAELDAQLARLEAAVGRRFGDPADPLLVAVRSGAPRSMPGMLDTVLNLGSTRATTEALAATGDERFAWETYRRFLLMYAGTVLGAPAGLLTGSGSDRDDVLALRDRLADAGFAVPDDPRDQLRGAVRAVFDSWDGDRARVYRQREGIADDLGTAVNVQAMVFGHADDASGTGVAFTRNPATGQAAPFGDFLARAQGEEVVAGSAATVPLAAMADVLPAAHAELLGHLDRLELHYRDLCDVEFTVERGRLWILQTRVGKRGAVAAVRVAAELARDPRIALTPVEVAERVPTAVREAARAEVLAAARQGAATAPPLATGLGASPGRVCGQVVLSADDAADADPDTPVVLVRPETSPEDVHGMGVSVGILTSRGGLVSHAAVVARGWGIPAVVGAGALVVGDDEVRDAAGVRLFGPGDVVTIDGATGAVWLGDHTAAGDEAATDDELLARLLPELAELPEGR